MFSVNRRIKMITYLFVATLVGLQIASTEAGRRGNSWRRRIRNMREAEHSKSRSASAEQAIADPNATFSDLERPDYSQKHERQDHKQRQGEAQRKYVDQVDEQEFIRHLHERVSKTITKEKYNDVALAEDAGSNVSLRLLQNGLPGDEIENRTAYLEMCVWYEYLRLCEKHRREEQSQSAVDLAEQSSYDSQLEKAIRDEETAMRHKLAQSICDFVREELKTELKDANTTANVFRLRFEEGMTFPEIAKLLGLKEERAARYHWEKLKSLLIKRWGEHAEKAGISGLIPIENVRLQASFEFHDSALGWSLFTQAV